MTENKTIFLIGHGDYSDAMVYHATFDKEKAEKYIAYKNMKEDELYSWWIDEVNVDDFEIGNVEGLKYGYKNVITFRNDVIYSIKKCKSYMEKDSVHISYANDSTKYVKVSFFSPKEIDSEKAKKIAYDMLAEYKAKENGVSI